MVNPKDIAENAEEEEEEWRTPEIWLGTQKKKKKKKKKNGEAQRYIWESRRRRRMVKPRDKPRDIAGNAEEEEKW